MLLGKSIDDDLPDPQDGESMEAFVQRCVDELGDYDPDAAEQACRAKWEDEGNGEESMGFKEYADPGYRADGKKRYPTDTPKLIRQSWYLLSKQIDEYTAAQLSRIQTRIINAWKVQISAEGPPTEPDMIELLRVAPRQAPEVVHKTHSTEGTGMEFILSDATPDRFGDIVEPAGWELDNFKKNPIALFGHDSSFPIGKWADIKAGDKDLRARLTLAPKGTSDRIDEIRNLIDADILRATSVGFKPIDSESLNPKDPWGGKRFIKHELVECSVVAVPANPNALAVAKSLGVSAGTLRMVFGEHADKSNVQRRDFSSRGKNADKAGTEKNEPLASMPKPNEQQGAKPMLLSKRIQDAEKHVLALQDSLDKHLETIDDQAPTDEQMVLTEDLTAKIETAQRHLTNLKAIEAKSASSAVDANSPDHQRRAVATARAPLGITFKEKKVEPLELLFRAARVRCMSKTENADVDVIRQKIYGDDELTRVACDLMLKAASAPAETTVAGWAAELVRTIWAAWMEALYPQSVFPKLSAAGLALTFGANGRIVIPTRSLTPSVSGSFVGEGQPIPVRQGAFASQTLTPKKMAVITTFTKEMQDYSMPAIEGLLRQMMLDDTAISLDTILLDNNPATAIRPPGLRSYQAGLTPSAVTPGYVNFVADYKALYGSLLGLTNGNVRSPIMIVNPTQALNLSLIQPPNAAAPLFPFISMVDGGRILRAGLIESATVPPGQVTMVDAADFTVAGEEGVRLEISDAATLHFEDTAPADIVSGPSGTEVIATPVKSLWQTDSLALRLIMRVNWVLRRPVVAWMTGVAW
jgi:HK97 family phage prohead protease